MARRLVEIARHARQQFRLNCLRMCWHCFDSGTHNHRLSFLWKGRGCCSSAYAEDGGLVERVVVRTLVVVHRLLQVGGTGNRQVRLFSNCSHHPVPGWYHFPTVHRSTLVRIQGQPFQVRVQPTLLAAHSPARLLVGQIARHTPWNWMSTGWA